MIKVFVINLSKRIDRRKHIINQFKYKKSFFEVEICEPIPYKKANVSLWLTIKDIIKNNINEEYIIICEDDHKFTKKFSFEFFNKQIIKAKSIEANILCGGVSWIQKPIQVTEDLFWMESFNGLQFTLIFKNSFKKILKAKFLDDDYADYKFSEIFKNKFLIYPFISIQKEFGYSDVTIRNNENGRVNELFNKTALTLKSLKKVKKFYSYGK